MKFFGVGHGLIGAFEVAHAEDDTRRTRVHKAPDFLFPGGVDQIGRAFHVDPKDLFAVAPHRGHRGHMKNHIHSLAGGIYSLRTSQIALHALATDGFQFGVFAAAEHTDFVAARAQLCHNLSAEKPAAASDQCFHCCKLTPPESLANRALF